MFSKEMDVFVTCKETRQAGPDNWVYGGGYGRQGRDGAGHGRVVRAGRRQDREEDPARAMLGRRRDQGG